jgi:hypothetical protein
VRWPVYLNSDLLTQHVWVTVQHTGYLTWRWKPTHNQGPTHGTAKRQNSDTCPTATCRKCTTHTTTRTSRTHDPGEDANPATCKYHSLRPQVESIASHLLISIHIFSHRWSPGTPATLPGTTTPHRQILNNFIQQHASRAQRAMTPTRSAAD